jgi:hypothetical protein
MKLAIAETPLPPMPEKNIFDTAIKNYELGIKNSGFFSTTIPIS